MTTSRDAPDLDAPLRIEAEHASIRAYSRTAADWAAQWLIGAARDFQQTTGRAMPRGTVFPIDPGNPPPAALHRHFRLRQPHGEPQTIFHLNPNDALEVRGAVDLRPALLSLASDASTGEPPHSWAVALTTDDFVRRRVRELWLSELHETGHRPDAAMLLVLPDILMEPAFTAYALKIAESDRRAIVFSAAVRALDVGDAERNRVLRRIRDDRNTALEQARADRPELPD